MPGRRSRPTARPISITLSRWAPCSRRPGTGEEVVAAGLLHDTVEDSETRLEDIASRFGDEVAQLVAAVTEPPDVEPYEARKAAHRGQVVAAGEEAAAIFAADKLVSARNLRGALAVRGEAAVDASLEQTLDRKLDHYASTVRELQDAVPSLPFLALLSGRARSARAPAGAPARLRRGPGGAGGDVLGRLVAANCVRGSARRVARPARTRVHLPHPIGGAAPVDLHRAADRHRRFVVVDRVATDDALRTLRELARRA